MYRRRDRPGSARPSDSYKNLRLSREVLDLWILALWQFKAAATVSLDIDDFVGAALMVYESTIKDDRGFRDIVVETLYNHSE